MRLKVSYVEVESDGLMDISRSFGEMIEIAERYSARVRVKDGETGPETIDAT